MNKLSKEAKAKQTTCTKGYSFNDPVKLFA